MRSLFAKIFAAFLLTHILASILVYAMLTATRPEPRGPRGTGAPGITRNRERASNGALPPNAASPGGGRLREGRRGGRPPRTYFEMMRWLAIFVAATGVSYGLARYLTAPIAKLRGATQQLAAGNLSTRVGAQMGKRRDELADLGCDFDLMAERIQSLLAAECRLLGDISHELRSPLARMQVALDLAEQTADEDTRSYLQRIERESARLNDLIGQLLILTRLETATVQAPGEPVDLAQLVSEVAADADFEARGQKRRVQIVQSEECRACGSSELLRRAVENVVRNAVHYTAEGTSVEIALRCAHDAQAGSTPGAKDAETPGCAIITVRDHGPGVPEEALEKLFDPFYRVALARDRQSGGVGLGLSITARAVRFHNGEVKAENAEGGGLVVEIRLPGSESQTS